MSYYEIGHAAVLLTRSGEKLAADVAAALSYGLKGKLYKSQSGWLLLTVPNALARGCFDALGELGAELPPSKGSAFNAHISVVRPEELALIKGDVTERGHDFSYTLGPVREVEPAGWPEMAKVWFIEVRSPDLEKLRKSYGLTPLPDGDKKPFHITFAVRRRAVLHDNEKSVGRIVKLTHLIHKPSQLFNDGYSQKAAALKPGVNLQKHQEEIAETGNEEERKMLLYHSLGSGKTLSGISAAETAGAPYTAVTPAALRENFRGEQAKFTDGTVPSNVTSYNALAQGGVPPTDTLLFDEAHRLRNPNTKGTAEATRLAEQAKHVYLLSGSPIVNRPNDLASLITILTGNKMTPEDFDNKFLDEQKVSPGLLGWLHGAKSGTQPAIKNRQEFHDLLKGHVNYYAPDKPGVDKQEESFHVPMSNQQQSLYQAFWDQLPFLLRWKLQRDFPLSREEINNLSSFLSGPRQVGLSTLPFMKGRQDPMLAFNQSPKLQKAFENLQAMRKDDPQTRAIVYSNFIDAGLKPYAAALAANKIPHAIFHGGLNDADRKRVVGDFNSGKSPVMLLGPSGGEGISLRHARLMQILDPHWNETRNDQAIGRGVRYDSHSDLPEDQRNIKVQRYFSQLPSGVWQRIWRKFVNRKPDNEINNPGTDLYLARMANKKEELNDVFRHELQDIGTEKAAQDLLKPVVSPQPSAALTTPKPAATSTAPTLSTLSPPGQKVPLHPSVEQTLDASTKTHNLLFGNTPTSPYAGPTKAPASEAVSSTLSSYPAAPLDLSAGVMHGDGYYGATSPKIPMMREAMTDASRAQGFDEAYASQSGLDILRKRWQGMPVPRVLPTESKFDNGSFNTDVTARGAGGKEYYTPATATVPLNAPSYPVLRTLGLGGIANHELEHSTQNMFSSTGRPIPSGNDPNFDSAWQSYRDAADAQQRVATEMPPGIGDIVFHAQQFKNTQGKPLQHTVQMPSELARDVEWMRRQAQQHGYFGGDGQPGKSMTELLGTPAGKAWLQNVFLPRTKMNAATVVDEADAWDPTTKQFRLVDVQRLIARVAGRKPEQLAISQIWGGSPTSPGFSEDRVAAADTQYPILVDDYHEGDDTSVGLVDGRHRKIKLQRQGATNANVIRLTPDDIAHAAKALPVEKTAGQVYEIRKSGIHGKGCFATKSFDVGEVIGKALHKMPDQLQTYDETTLGRFINHADEDNTGLRDEGDGTYSLIATRAITSGEELTANYRDADELLGPGHTYTYEGKPLQIAEDDPTEEKTAGLRNDLLKEIERARGETDTNPTEEQKKAGNYTKGKFSLHGLQISLENPKGSTRSGTDKSGKAWSITMAHDYGYIRGTISDADADHVDCFIGPNPEGHMVFIIDQNDPATGKFDEHKVIFGASTKAEAEVVYLSCYDKDWKGLGGTRSMHLYEFKRWLKTGDTGIGAVGQTVQKAAELRPEAVDGAPYRDRAEVYSYAPEHGIYGGQFDNDKTFAVPGGGVDEGEDIAAAASREFLEETGMRVKNPRVLPIDPVTTEWSPEHKAKLPPDRQKYRGSRTHFVHAEPDDLVPGPGKLDRWGAGARRFYTLDEALKVGDGKTPLVPNVFAARMKVLEHLRSLATPSVLPLLQQAKAESDKRNYSRKAQILRGLMQQVPADWQVDAPRGSHHGVTHTPTRFKFHLPPKAIPATVKRAAAPPALRAILQPRGLGCHTSCGSPATSGLASAELLTP